MRSMIESSYIEVGNYVFRTCHAVTIKSSWKTLGDTCTIQLPNFKRHSFAVEVEIVYSDHTLGVPEDNVERYTLPATYVRLLSGNKQINVEEDYTPIADAVSGPVESMRHVDNAIMFKNKPANQIRNIVNLCPPKTFDACMKGEFNNLRALQLYQDLQIQVVTPAKIATYTKGFLYRGAQEFRAIKDSAFNTITATSLTFSPISYGANAMLIRNGKAQSLFSI